MVDFLPILLQLFFLPILVIFGSGESCYSGLSGILIFMSVVCQKVSFSGADFSWARKIEFQKCCLLSTYALKIWSPSRPYSQLSSELKTLRIASQGRNWGSSQNR